MNEPGAVGATVHAADQVFAGRSRRLTILSRMAKTTKDERAALEAIDEAADAVSRAKKLRRSLPKKQGRKLDDAIDEARDAVAAVEHKERLRADARAAAEAAEAAERAAALRAEEAKAARKAARRAEKDAARAERAAELASDALTVQLAARPVEPDAEAEGALAAMTVAQLRAKARSEGRSGYSRLAKAALIDLLS